MNNEPSSAIGGRTAQADSRKWGFVALHAGEDNNASSQETSICVSLSLLALSPTPSNNSAEMAAVYYERIDVEGHHYGPLSQQRKNALKEVDKALSNMISLIKVSGSQKPSSWVPLEKAFKTGLFGTAKSLFNTCN